MWRGGGNGRRIKTFVSWLEADDGKAYLGVAAEPGVGVDGHGGPTAPLGSRWECCRRSTRQSSPSRGDLLHRRHLPVPYPRPAAAVVHASMSCCASRCGVMPERGPAAHVSPGAATEYVLRQACGGESSRRARENLGQQLRQDLGVEGDEVIHAQALQGAGRRSRTSSVVGRSTRAAENQAGAGIADECCVGTSRLIAQ